MAAIVATGVILARAPLMAGGAEVEPAPRAVPASHARMLAVLKQIAERTPQDNPYLGDASLLKLRRMISELPDDASIDRRFTLTTKLAVEELRVGQNDKAIEELTAAYALLPKLPEEFRKEHSVLAAYNLGIAYLRWGETQNCVARHTSDSCILPIRGRGVHSRPEGSKMAVRYFTEVLEATAPSAPENLAAKWLLNISIMTLGSYPDGVPAAHLIPPKTFASEEEFPRFTDIAPRLGVNTFDLAGGAIADDFDGDGLLDLVESCMDTAGSMHFFRNNGDGSFSDLTAKAGLTGLYGGLNMIHADYDNDGDPDILVLRGAWFGEAGCHPNSLLRNNGDGTFTDVTFDAGLAVVSYPTQTASWGDYDNDGDVDLYVGNEATAELNYPCQLFRNNGDRTFTDVARQAGVENMRFAKAVVWGDYDGDRFPDLYVSNLSGNNRLYRNNGNGTFSDLAPLLGVERPLESFPAWFWDFDNDGVLDLYVSSYYQKTGPARLAAFVASTLGVPHEAEMACLYRGDGRGGFREVAAAKNLIRLNMPMGSNFGDLDNDGYLDFYLGTGYPAYDGLVPNVMYWNRRGERFADVTTAGGFGHLQKGHAVVFADFDNDGDQDIFEQMGGAFPGDAFADVLYENPGFGNNWIGVKLIGVKSNRSAIGARIRAEVIDAGDRRSIYKHVNSGGTFGANPLRQQLGLAKARRIERLSIFWPTSGTTQIFRNVAINQSIEITEGKEGYRRLALKKIKLG